jgi:nanoRNase/pAp phosphatase (c-di-AMP/oligoRNAs hydrolase)
LLPAFTSRLRELIDGHEHFLHVTHVNPDADGVGSALAMHRWLKRQGKRSRVIVPSEFPAGLSFMHEKGEVEVGDPAELSPWPADAVTIVYDVSSLRRFAGLEEALRAAEGPMLCIDHHDAATDFDCDSYIDESAGATGQMVQLLLEELGVELDPELAIPLYVAIIADTGSFNYGKTSPVTHRCAARLLEAGVDPLDVHGRLEGNHPHAALRAAGAAMARIELDPEDPRIACLVLDEALRSSAGPEGLEGLDLVNRTIAIRGVLAGVLIKEHGENESRLSFRSKGSVSVVEAARFFGGGGHRNAAGAAAERPPEAIKAEVLAKLREELSRQLGPPER